MNARTFFLGVFRCSIQDGRIRIPWTPEHSTDRFVWELIACDNGTEKLVLTDEGQPKDSDDSDYRVLHQGVCALSENGDWIMPQAALEFLNVTECVWMGCFDFGELMTAKKYDAWHNEESLEFDKKLLDQIGLL